ncbi:MAG: protein-L-isoaspartate O-methyltransferase [Moraxellaceae bacterium]|nr:MAG: protein-L-isoaspartate O-methyltransferase [Moraxellaceae bacterium]
MTSQRTRDRLVERLKAQGIENLSVLEVIRSTPRHLFVDEALAHRAYEDTALPVGFNQTISQPYVVALMTEVLVNSGSMGRVLEVGSGCGYQTTVLAQLAEKVYSVERIKGLLDKARQRIKQLKLNNVHFNYGDGTLGWEEHGPYDAIIVTAAPENIPEALLNQLAEGGRMVIPVGDRNGQDLVLVSRRDNSFEKQVIESVQFVPFISGSLR